MYLLTYPDRVWGWLRSLPRGLQLDPIQLLIKLLECQLTIRNGHR